MSRVVHIKSREVAMAESTQRLVEFLSSILPRQPMRDRRGRVKKGVRGHVVYPPFRLLEENYSTLVYHVNQCRMAAGLEPINGNVMEDE
jgi:hypothetical protein